MQLQNQIGLLRLQVQDARQEESSQTNSFTAASTAITIASGAVVVLLTLGGVLATVLGYRFVKTEVSKIFENRVDVAIREHGQEVFGREAGALREEWDTKFADLYEQARRASNG